MIETVAAQVPPEPPVGTVVVSAGRVRQSTDFADNSGGSYRVYVGVGEVPFFPSTLPSWLTLLARGPVDIVWRPDENVSTAGARTAAHALLVAIAAGGLRPTADAAILDAAQTLRDRLDRAAR